MDADDDRPETPSRPTVQLDDRQIRVLAHPLRARLLGELRLRGPATATTLAQRLDTNTGATSYHLRQLAEVGLVTEEPDRGTGRQRWWRAAHELSSWRPTDFDDPDARAASDWLQGYQVRQMVEQAERWINAQRELAPAWQEAGGISDDVLTLTPERLSALNREIWQLIQRYRQEWPPEAEGVELVHVYYAAFPRVEETR